MVLNRLETGASVPRLGRYALAGMVEHETEHRDMPARIVDPIWPGVVSGERPERGLATGFSRRGPTRRFAGVRLARSIEAVPDLFENRAE